MIHYTKWFLPKAAMYNLDIGYGFTSSRMMNHLRLAVRAAKEHSFTYYEHKAAFLELILALYEFDAIDYETYEHGTFKVNDLLSKIYDRNEYKDIF